MHPGGMADKSRMRKRFGWVLVAGSILALLVMMAGKFSKPQSTATMVAPVPAGVRVGADLSRDEVLAAMQRVQWIVPKALEQTDPNYLMLVHSSARTDETLVEFIGDKTALERLKDHPRYASVGALADSLLLDRHWAAIKRVGADEWYEANAGAIRAGDKKAIRELKSRYWQAVLSDRGVKKTAMGGAR
jgi:hypothetical protein